MRMDDERESRNIEDRRGQGGLGLGGGARIGGFGLIAVVVAVGMSIWRSRQSKLVTTYGSARWANAEDIHKAGLDQSAGVFAAQPHVFRHGPAVEL